MKGLCLPRFHPQRVSRARGIGERTKPGMEVVELDTCALALNSRNDPMVSVEPMIGSSDFGESEIPM